MTETTSMVTFANPRARLADAGADERLHARQAQGVPLPLCEIRIVDEEQRDLPWDGVAAGELLVRSPWVASAYFQDERTSHLDGWLCTGDVATIDPDGQLRLVDRKRDLVKSGGEWISSIELEGCLTEHPAVQDAAVVAVPDPKWLERPVAFITISGPVNDEDLRRHVEAVHPRFWVPDRFIVLDALPRTNIGKSDKRRLRAMAHAPEVLCGGAS
jgi:fatty-acyl-CoA synthase